jgi:hypothetical protein
VSRFPVTTSQADGRFSFGVTADVAKVLASHGFPGIMSFYDGAEQDFERLAAVLKGFVYGELGADLVTGPDGDDRLSLVAATASAPGLPETAYPAREANAPVEVRLIGSPAVVARAAKLLELLFSLSYISEPYAARDGRARVYLTAHVPTGPAGGIS